jgi:beta-N-acetylhexosaminidase
MKFRKRIAIVSIWLIGIALVVIGACKNEPVLVSLRGAPNALIVAATLVAAVAFVRRGHWSRRGVAGKALVLLWVLPSLAMLYATLSFEIAKRNVLQTDAARAQSLGPHFLVGYTSFAEVAQLAEKGLIGGVYIAKHNVAGRTPDAVKAEIAALQERRRVAGLPPLIVAADQEGGIVSHLSPPLRALPALSTLAAEPLEIRERMAAAYGRAHGRELAALGVNLNLAPVLDLKPATRRAGIDLNTLIKWRAISNDPAIVTDIALAYVHGLEAFGVGATLKHFPGLGRVQSDTHLFSASLDASLEELEASDWRPFREVLAGSKAQLMIGHVNLAAIDPDRPASHSKLVIDGLIRKRWNFQGLILTDDLVMGAIYRHNVCEAVVEALNAGADLLVVAFDGGQFYRVFACASDAADRVALDIAMLQASAARLTRSFPDTPRPGWRTLVKSTGVTVE